MKSFKKITMLLAILASTSLFAQEGAAPATPAAPAAAQPQVVTTTGGMTVSVTDNGNDGMSISVSAPKDGTISNEDALKKIMQAVLDAMTSDSQKASLTAISALIKANMGDPSAPMATPINVSFTVKNIDPETVVVNTVFVADNATTTADTKTTVNPDGTATTIGNVSTTGADGVVGPSAPVSLTADENGSVTGDVGGKSVTDVSDTATQAEVLKTPTSQKPTAGGVGASVPVPDPTVVTSGSEF